MKKVFFCFCLFLLSHTALEAAFVVVGNPSRLTSAQKADIYKTLVTDPFPDIDRLNQKYRQVEIIYIPDTTYQVLELTLSKDSYISNQYSRFYTVTDFLNLQTKIDEIPTNSYMSNDFWIVNDLIVEKGRSKIALEAAAIQVFSSKKNHDFISQPLYSHIIALEETAYKNKNRLFWRFSNGIADFPGWVDSPFKMPLNPQKPELHIGDSSKSGHSGLSFAARPLDGVLQDVLTLDNPFKDYTASLGSACTLNFLDTQLKQVSQLLHLQNKQQEKTRLKALSHRTLFALSIPQSELETMKRHVYDSQGLTPFFMGARARGEYFHPTIFIKAKNYQNVTLSTWGENPFYSYQESTPGLCAFLQTYFKWMAKNLHVLYAGNEFSLARDNAAARLIYETYQDFYANKLPQVLGTLSGTSTPKPEFTIADTPTFVSFSQPKPQRTAVSLPKAQTAIERLEELLSTKPTHNGTGAFVRSYLLITGRDASTKKHYGFRVKGPSATYAEKRTILAALVADAFYNQKVNNPPFTPAGPLNRFVTLSTNWWGGYSSDGISKIKRHIDLVKSALYAITYIFQNKSVNWHDSSGRKEAYFNDLYEPGHNRSDNFVTFVLNKRQEFEKNYDLWPAR